MPHYEWCSADPVTLRVPEPNPPRPAVPELLDGLAPGVVLPTVPASPARQLEPLVPVEDPRIRVLGAYWHEGWPFARPGAFVRSEVLARLRSALDCLPHGFGFAVWDAWRDPRLQELLYERAYADPWLPPGFVHEPSSDPARPSPHTTGGTVDLTLTWRNVPLGLGTGFDAFVPRAFARSLEGPDAVAADRLPRDLRRLLRSAMTARGFVQLASEWWHFEFGTRLWAAVTGRDALYGGHAGPSAPSEGRDGA